ncbi:MAG: histidine kinase, partial [Burkholderiales bacterium PBB5]
MPLWHAADGAHWPALPLALLAAADGEAAVTRLRQARTDAVWLALPPATAWVPVLPAAALAVLDRGAPPPEALRQAVQGRVVLVGSSALQAEAVMTAQGQWPATQVQAQAYAALRDGLWAQPPSALAALLLMALALLPSAVLVTRGQAEARRDMGVTAAALLAMTGMVAGGLLLWRQPALLAAPLLTLAGGVALMLLAQQRLLQARQQQVLQALAVAEASAAARRQVLAQVSHEVRTPLHALLGVADLLADGPLAPAQQQQVRVLRDAGHSLLALINDLLDLARIDAGRLVLTRQPFSLSAMLSHLEALMRPRAQGQGLALRFELAADLPDGVLGDHQRLSQGLANLLGNALKFTRQGQVLLRVQRAAPSGDELLFEVVDTGIGIAPSKLDQVFEPFAQADDSVARQYGGTGLGLAITRRVAQQMGGSLTVRSSPGQGSAFCLRLPLPVAVLPQPPAEPADGAALLDTGGRTLRVLLAEDNPVNVMLFEAQLAGQPLVIDTVVDGREALARLTERAYDLAFLDVEMPHLDGLGVTRALRQLEARTGRRRTPVVVVTANAYPDDIARSQAAGSDRHVAKPFGRAVLLQALQQLACPPAAAGPAAATVAAPAESAPPAVPLLDVALALHQLGGDAVAFGRAADHAEVFLA